MLLAERLCVFLKVAEVANIYLSEKYPETSLILKEAILYCWAWLGERTVKPELLSQYLDGEISESPCLQESLFERDSRGLNALIFITMVVGYTARLAYESSGRLKEMSEVIECAGDVVIDSILEYGRDFGLQG